MASDRENPGQGHTLRMVHIAARRSGTTLLEAEKGTDYTHEDKHDILVHSESGKH